MTASSSYAPAKELPWAPRPGTHGEELADEDD